MEIEIKLKKQVSSDQLNALLEFLKEHKKLAKGLTRSRRGKLKTLKLWNLCAEKLNLYEDGATKDGKGWSKYWCDWKYRVCKRALEQQASNQNTTTTTSTSDNSTPLSTLEEEILDLIGRDALDSVVMKMDEAEKDLDNTERNSNGECSGTQPKLICGRKRRHTSRDHEDSDDSSDRKPKLPDNVDSEDAKELLRVEKEKLEYAMRSQQTLQLISSEITRLTNVMSHIRDLLMNNRVNA